MTEQIRGMRSFHDADGAVFDVPEDILDRFEDIFGHLKDSNRLDFEIGRCKSLPELKEDEYPAYAGGYGGGNAGGRGGFQGGYGQRFGGNQGGYGGQQHGGYGDRNQSYGGGQSSGYGGAPATRGGGRSDDAKTVFVGNLGFNSSERDIDDIFRK